MRPTPADYAAVVRTHHKETVGWLLAQGHPCTVMRDDEIRNIRRDLRPLSYGDLQGWTPTGSWMLAVVLCPGDDLSPLIAWIRRQDSADLERIRFYAHPRADLVRLFTSWYEKGLEDPLVTIVRDWTTLHPPFGRDLNDRVYRDALAK